MANPESTPTLSDSEVVERIQAGETALYSILIRRHHNDLRHVASRVLRSDTEAEDVLQEAHLRAFQHLDRFNGLSSFSTWLMRITLNQALTHLRSRKVTEQIDENRRMDRPVVSPMAPAPQDPEQYTSGRELNFAVKTAVSRLPAAYRPVVILREIEELSTMEVAQRLGISESCAKTRLSRAKKLLRTSLAEWGESKGAPSSVPLARDRMAVQ